MAKKKRRRLTPQDVEQIREDYTARRYTQAQLAEEYDVSVSLISRICSGALWPDAPGPVRPAGQSVGRPRRLTPDEVRQIREAYAAGKGSYRALAEKYGVSPSTVQAVVAGRRFTADPGPITQPRPKKRLSPEEIQRIRELYRAGTSRAELARQFGVHRATIDRAVTGRTHPYAPGPVARHKRGRRRKS